MQEYVNMDKAQLLQIKDEMSATLEALKAKAMKLNMARGMPGREQLDLSEGLSEEVGSANGFKTESGVDCRNYGLPDGLPQIKKLFAEILGVPESGVIVGGNSSLSMMFDTVSQFITHGVCGGEPWIKQGNVKFLCPVPGYDRHFGVTGYFGIEMITVPMDNDGPDMDTVEQLVAGDASIKGIWCVPMYSNPTGITYSDEVVRRMAALKPVAPDFRVFWDNAYCCHHLTDNPDRLLNIYDEAVKVGNEDIVLQFASFSKISFAGSGVAAVAASPANIAAIKKRITLQTIGPDKINQLRHVRFFKDLDGVKAHMKKYEELLKPKFDAVQNALQSELGGLGIGNWSTPNGGYFVSFDALPGCAKKIIALCADAGMAMTPAGATFPHGIDPQDSNIRIAPTFPPVSELEVAMQIFCAAVKLCSAEKLLG